MNHYKKTYLNFEKIICVCVCVCVWGGGGDSRTYSISKTRSLKIYPRAHVNYRWLENLLIELTIKT